MPATETPTTPPPILAPPGAGADAPLDAGRDAGLGGLVRSINHLHADATIGFARALGRLVLDALYGGSPEAWRARRGHDPAFQELRRLFVQDELRVSPVQIWRALSLVELEHRLSISTWESLTFSHIRELFTLPEAQQRALIELGRGQAIPARRFQELCAEARRKTARRPVGRPPVAKANRVIRQVLRDLREAEFEVSLVQAVAEDPDGTGSACLQLLEDAREQLSEIIGRLRRQAPEREQSRM